MDPTCLRLPLPDIRAGGGLQKLFCFALSKRNLLYVIKNIFKRKELTWSSRWWLQ